MDQAARRPLADEVYERLQDLLGSESFPRDSRLPAELDLARRFAVSRPVLRQALARLREEGHVVSRKGSGSYVRAPTRPAAPGFGPLHSIPDMRGFLEFRCSLESEVAAHAARRADPAAVAAIRQALLRLEEDPAALEADVAFHHAIARATGNRFFLTTLEAFREQMISGIRLTRELAGRPEGDRRPEIAREHARIAEAIAAADEQAARQAMADHLHGGIRRLFGA
ncbi:FadR/GntR family transcriptional regulator [Pararoseomonas indoligenes]|uniref:FadR family transcriptional regulator n=1 Tax=Roseomonas indoligenes TaxID=2820811 RepID=A0A940MXY5_9PROT|nr:FCD domain-containing protein [Pararoseomonas indoligenes]MBP0495439.1 FadR family transcriptional regulator [Pararoseomonas indoligenes]